MALAEWLRRSRTPRAPPNPREPHVQNFSPASPSLRPAEIPPLAGQAQDAIKLGYAKCAHCTPLALTPANASNVKLEAIAFNTGNDVLTALLSKSIDVAQVTYLHYATALDKGFDVVAISGQINGGSQILVGNDLPLAENDWAGLKKLIAEYKAQGKPFRVAARAATRRTLHMRGALFATGHRHQQGRTVHQHPEPVRPRAGAASRRGRTDLLGRPLRHSDS